MNPCRRGGGSPSFSTTEQDRFRYAFSRQPAARRIGVLVLGLVLGLAGCSSVPSFSQGRFHHVPVMQPAGTPEALVLLLSGSHGVSQRDRLLADTLTGQGALVALLDTPRFLASLAGDDESCSMPDGDLENLGHALEAAYNLPGYRPPILAGDGIGATLALASAAQSDDQANAPIFAGVITTAFTPRLNTAVRLCNTAALHTVADAHGLTLNPPSDLTVPWVDQQADAPATQRLRSFVAASAQATLLPPGLPQDGHRGDRPLAMAFHGLRSRQQALATAALPASVADLPLTILPAAKAGTHPDTMVIFLSGDGGWAGIDKQIGGALAAAGMPVVGFDSLRYYWHAHSPETSAHDLARVMRYYSHAWHRPRILLVGYSRGADVLPFMINRLPAEEQHSIQRVALLALGSHITFKFHVINWFGFSNDGLPVTPEAAALPAGLAVCLYGTDDDDSICQRLDANRIQQIGLAGGHHFDGGYEQIAALILANLNPATGITTPAATGAGA